MIKKIFPTKSAFTKNESCNGPSLSKDTLQQWHFAEFCCAAAFLFILGTVYVHPYITYPLFSYQRSFLPHIKTFETSEGFAQIYEAIVNQDEGRKKVLKNNDEEKTKEYEYFWKKVRT